MEDFRKSVVYQIYPKSFYDTNGDGLGDLNGVTEKLDYIRELGVDYIWMTPFFVSPQKDNGYDVEDYYNIDPRYGTMEDFDRMISEMHKRGLKLVMDLVVNHTSDEHAWFVESRSSRENPYRDYYIWREGKNGKEPNNWGSCFSGSAWEYDKTTDMYYLHLFSKKQPDLNWDNPAVRRDIFSMMNWWCEKGIDGFRMDVISMISKREVLPDVPTGGAPYGPCGLGCCNGPHVHEYLQEMRRKVLSNYDLLTVGECAGVTIDQAKQYANAQGTELNMVFQFEHVDLDGGDPAVGKWSTRKMDLVALKKLLSRWQDELDGVAWNSLYFCNHDQPRIVSRLGDDSPRYREISAKSIATCLHMMQGTPYVYQGEELGMTNAPYPVEELRDLESINAYNEMVERGMSESDALAAIHRMMRDNARTPMQWTAGPHAGFTDGDPWMMVNPNYTEINAAATLADPDSVFYTYQKLIALRKTHRVFVEGDFTLLCPEDEQVFAYLRRGAGQEMLVAVNLSGRSAPFALPEAFEGRAPLLATQGAPLAGALRPWEALICLRDL